jgi:hypothetical protein
MKLQYPDRCAACNGLLVAGTEVNYVKNGSKYEYLHLGECPDASSAPPRRHKKPAEDIYDLRQCSNAPCSNAVGTAYPKGGAPPVCERCGSAWEWTSEDGWAEEAAA